MNSPNRSDEGQSAGYPKRHLSAQYLFCSTPICHIQILWLYQPVIVRIFDQDIDIALSPIGGPSIRDV